MIAQYMMSTDMARRAVRRRWQVEFHVLAGGCVPGPDLLQAGLLFRKNVGPLIYEYPVTPPPDCLHPTLSGPTRTVVIIDILFRTRAAMHTTIAAAADWQFEASLSEANCKRVRKYCPFVRAAFLWGPLFGRTC